MLKERAEQKKVLEKLEIICEDFFKFKNVKAELVFLNPSINDETIIESFSIFKHISPDIRDSLDKALSMS